MTSSHDSLIRPTVLCVDDDACVLRALERVLVRHGCRVLTATRGRASLDVMAGEQVEVLICDESMPGMQGTEVLAQAMLISPSTSRILLTGRCNDPEVVMRAVNGCQVFRLLAKPWNDEELCRAVSDALGSKPEDWGRCRTRMEQRLSAFGLAGR